MGKQSLVSACRAGISLLELWPHLGSRSSKLKSHMFNTRPNRKRHTVLKGAVSCIDQQKAHRSSAPPSTTLTSRGKSSLFPLSQLHQSPASASLFQMEAQCHPWHRRGDWESRGTFDENKKPIYPAVDQRQAVPQPGGVKNDPACGLARLSRNSFLMR